MSVTLNGTYSIHTPIDSLLKRVRILNSVGVCRQLILTRFHFTFPQKKSSASRKTNSLKPRGRNAKEVIYVVVSFLNLTYSAACKESSVRPAVRPGLVYFSVLNLPNGQVKVFRGIQITEEL